MNVSFEVQILIQYLYEYYSGLKGEKNERWLCCVSVIYCGKLCNSSNAFSRFPYSLYDRLPENTGYSPGEGPSQPAVTHLKNVATGIAEFLYESAGGASSRLPDLTANATLIDGLLQCYLVTAECKMFAAAANK